MRFSWKEILVIFVLGVLATGLSLIYGRLGSCPKVNCSPGGVCLDITCAPVYVRGWPMPSYTQFDGVLIPLMIIDFLFYFAIFGAIWFGSKLILRKLKKS